MVARVAEDSAFLLLGSQLQQTEQRRGLAKACSYLRACHKEGLGVSVLGWSEGSASCVLGFQQYWSAAAACKQHQHDQQPSLCGWLYQVHQAGCSLLPPLYAAVPLTISVPPLGSAVLLFETGSGLAAIHATASPVCGSTLQFTCACPVPLQCPWGGLTRAWLHGETHSTDWSAPGQLMQGRQAL